MVCDVARSGTVGFHLIPVTGPNAIVKMAGVGEGVGHLRMMNNE